MPTGSEGVPIYYNNSRDQDICRVSRAFLPRLPECQYLRQVLTSSFQQSIPFKNCCLQRSGTLWDCHIVPLLQIWCLTPKAIQNVYKNVSIADIRCQQNSLFNHCIPHKFAHHGAKVFINSCCILESKISNSSISELFILFKCRWRLILQDWFSLICCLWVIYKIIFRSLLRNFFGKMKVLYILPNCTSQSFFAVVRFHKQFFTCNVIENLIKFLLICFCFLPLKKLNSPIT